MHHLRNSAQNGGVNPWLVQIDRAMRANDMAEASRLAGSALDLGYRHPALFNLRALGRRARNQNEAALADLLLSNDLNPSSPWTLGELADCHNALAQSRKAVATADSAIAVDRNYSRAWFQKGVAHQALAQLDAARSAYLEVARLEPTHNDAHARLASIEAEQGRFEEARRFANVALMSPPGHPLAAVALITADMGQDRLEEAERRLTAFLSRADVPPSIRSIAIAQLGDLRDLQGRTDEAFAAYTDSRSMWADFHAPQWRSGEFGHAQVLRLSDIFRPLPAGPRA